MIVVRTGCRLHFGFFAYGRTAGRNFGGIGATLAEPGWEVGVDAGASEDVVDAPVELRSRIEAARDGFRSAFGDRQASPCRIAVRKSVPLHAGLGGGTQLGLAVAQGMALLYGEGRRSAVELARAAGRGQRSAVGVHGFARGGFLVDSGKRSPAKVGTLASRVEIPAEWRWVLFTPTDASGLSGQDELSAFEQLPPMPPETTNRLCGLVLTELLPALVEQDFSGFSRTLHTYGRAVGEHFAPLQDGVYADATARRIADFLAREGVAGHGQSSWGPTLFALCASEDDATSLATEVRSRFQVSAIVSRPLNTGAAIQPECS